MNPFIQEWLAPTTTTSTTPTEALILAGGFGSDNSVEAFIPSTGTHCRLPDLPGDPRVLHTMEEMTVCGGREMSTRRSCLTLIDGTWQETTTLVEPRYYHFSWASPSGTRLLGGYDSRMTSERIQENGTSVRGFPLGYDVSRGCLINLGSTVILTGGVYSDYTYCSEYNENGKLRDLPQLQQGRYGHSCSYFENEDGSMTFLVTGGYNENIDGKYLSSTELLKKNAASWIYSEALPSPPGRIGLRGVNIDNRLLMTGGYRSGKDILEYNPSTGNWSLVGQMMIGRNQHAVSIVPAEDINMYC